VGRTYKDQRDWERKQGGKPRRDILDEEYDRKNRHYKLDDIVFNEEDLDEYGEYDLDYYD
jgi:hypothetical protein